MCGRYEVHSPIEDLARQFDAALSAEAAELPPRYNIAPSLKVPAVRIRHDVRQMDALVWGLVPNWAKNTTGHKPINARVEEVFDKPMFRNAIRRRRCLIPADGFYEWQQLAGRKQPWHIGMADDRPFALGGVWEYWKQEGKEPIVSCCVLVTQANRLLHDIHDRMPVIIGPEDYARWLDVKLTEPDDINDMLKAYPENEMRAYKVSQRVSNANNDDPTLIEPQED
jgi:putative SOS response-associated peptidase YedK